MYFFCPELLSHLITDQVHLEEVSWPLTSRADWSLLISAHDWSDLKVVSYHQDCVTQLKLDTGEKLSSPIFCCLSVCLSVRHRCHPTKCPLFPIYTGIQALCWPNTIYKGIKALFWVTHSILGLVSICLTAILGKSMSHSFTRCSLLEGSRRLSFCT